MYRNLSSSIFILIFTPFFLICWIYIYLIPMGLKVSYVLLVGFAVLIIGFYAFVNLNQEDGSVILFKIKGLSENHLKIFLFITMIIASFIPPTLGSKTVILWSRVSFLNYFKAIVFIIGCAFLPGANIYSSFFHKKNLHEHFKVESYFLKLTLYPLLSFSFIGVIVLLLDQLNFTRELILFHLIFYITILFFFDLIKSRIRNHSINYTKKPIKISKNSTIIHIFTLGISLISIGFFFKTLYLISSDSWTGLHIVYYIGDPNLNPIEDKIYFENYPIFWSYIIYGLSILSGLPYINVNAMLAPFCYLFVTTMYLLIKGILYDFEEKYAVLSTIFVSTFSNLNFLFSNYTGNIDRVGLIVICEFYFIYKSFSYCLLFFSLALFVVLINNDDDSNFSFKQLFRNEIYKYLILISFLLIVSYMTYMFPLLLGILLIFIFSIFLNKRKNFQNFYYYSLLYFLLVILFIVFDVLMNYYLSISLIFRFLIFYKIEEIIKLEETMSWQYLVYSFLLVTYMISSSFLYFYSKIYNILWKKERKDFSNNFNSKNKIKTYFRVGIFIFSILLIIEIISKIYEFIFGFDKFRRNYFFFFYLDTLILSFGVIGISAVYLSYFFFKKNKKIFILLTFWIFLTFSIAFLLLIRANIEYSNKLPKTIPFRDYHLAITWFERIWFYSIPPLCIISSIGVFDVVKKLKAYKIFKNYKYSKPCFKHITFCFLIFLVLSGLITSGMWYGSDKYRVRNNKIRIIGYVSENIPHKSKILTEDDPHIMQGLYSMTSCRPFKISEHIKEEYNEIQLNDRIQSFKNHEIKYLIVSEDLLSQTTNVSRFIKNRLIPEFYNETEYETSDWTIYYAPYFE